MDDGHSGAETSREWKLYVRIGRADIRWSI
jgi:hypothetical protein